MEINETYLKAAEGCLYYNIPFALFALPGETDFTFFASLPDSEGCSPAFAEGDDGDTFFINFFDNDEPYTAGVRRELSAEEVLEYVASCNPADTFREPDIYPLVSSTHRVSYANMFRGVMPRLKEFGGKVVISRHEALFSPRPLLDVVCEYFQALPSTFRYLVYTPESGVWFAATPELLLRTHSSCDCVETMSLAGTKLTSDTAPWDDKNVEEHEFVTEFIRDNLADEGLDVEVGSLCELQFSHIKHLCNHIRATGHVDPLRLMSCLSPTPAVAGMPRDVSLVEIDTFETHCRRCYGGYVGVRLCGDYHAYVNLRCAFAARARTEIAEGWLYNLYAGGGIVNSSVEAEEWAEACSKTSLLESLITKDVPCEMLVFTPSKIKFVGQT